MNKRTLVGVGWGERSARCVGRLRARWLAGGRGLCTGGTGTASCEMLGRWGMREPEGSCRERARWRVGAGLRGSATLRGPRDLPPPVRRGGPKALPPARLLEGDHRLEEPRAEPARGGPGRARVPRQHRGRGCGRGWLCPRGRPSSGSTVPGGVHIQTTGARAGRSLGPAVTTGHRPQPCPARGCVTRGGGTGPGQGEDRERTGAAPPRRRIPRV